MADTKPRSLLAHPIPLVAIALLVLNDHILKARYPGWATGKLSDFAGLTFFPLFLGAALELIRRAPLSRKAIIALCIVTGLVFSWVKTTTLGQWVYDHGLGALQWPVRAVLALASGEVLPAVAPVSSTLDPSDLIALPMLAVAAWVGLRRPPGDPRVGQR